MENKLNILYVSHHAGLNGAPRSMLDMIKGLKEEIYPIILLPCHGPLERELRIKNIKYYIVPYMVTYRIQGERNLKKELEMEKVNCKAIIEVVKIIKYERINIIHSNSIAVDIGARVAFLMRIPHVWHVRELLEEDFGFELINRRRIKNLLQYSSRRIAISETVKRKYEKEYALKMIVYYNGIDIDNYYQEPEIFVNKNNIRLLLCGDIIEKKGQKEAVEAMKILRSKGEKSFFLTIIGNGNKNYMKMLQKYIWDNELKDCIKLSPFSNDLSVLRRESDISLTCSKMEALGRVTIEAMLAGNCVIGANSGGTKELIGNSEEFGYLYQQGDSVSLAKTILRACKNPEKTRKKIDEARTMIMKKVNLECYSRNIYHMYCEVYKEAKNKKYSLSVSKNLKMM